MYNRIIIICLFFLVSCQQKEAKITDTTVIETRSGKVLFENLGNCATCHKKEDTNTGPGILTIAKMYKDKKGNMVAFLKEEAKPIVDPEKYITMRINLGFTKTLSDEELKEIERYILEYK
jgi:cytochrome c